MKTIEQPNDAARHTTVSAAATVIFLHVPKTAGTTLNRLIEWEYPVLQMYSVDPVFSGWSRKHLRKLSTNRLRRIRMLKGHIVFGIHEILPQPATYITVLREPVNRVLSAYYFMHNYTLHPYYWNFRRQYRSLEDFVHRSLRANVQCKILAGADYEVPCTPEIYAKAIEHIDHHFSVVGLSERFEESLALMRLRCGWKLRSYSSFNVTRARPKKRDLPQNTLDLIAEKNAFDVALYKYAAKNFEEAIQRNSEEIARLTQEVEAARTRTQGRVSSMFFALRSTARKALSRAYSAS